MQQNLEKNKKNVYHTAVSDLHGDCVRPCRYAEVCKDELVYAEYAIQQQFFPKEYRRLG